MKKAVLNLPEQHANVLRQLLERVPPENILWALTGSAGLCLQGVDISVDDLDLQTDAKSVFLLEEALAEFMKVPVHLWETDHTHSYHGQAEINGLQVELLGDVRHLEPDGSWGPALDVDSVRIWLEWHNFRIPVFPLEHEAAAYTRMGRVHKAKLIRAAIRKDAR